MSVYVDHGKIPYGRMQMSHMLADTLIELHHMAAQIGVDLRHFQGPSKASTPHYDICQSKRALAVKFGAKEVTRHELVEVIQRLRRTPA